MGKYFNIVWHVCQKPLKGQFKRTARFVFKKYTWHKHICITLLVACKVMSSSTMKITGELQFWWCQLEGKPGSTHTYETSSHIYFAVKVLEHCILLQCHFSLKFHTVSPRLSNISVNSRRRITPPAVNSWETITSQHNCITPLLSEADNIRKRKQKQAGLKVLEIRDLSSCQSACRVTGCCWRTTSTPSRYTPHGCVLLCVRALMVLLIARWKYKLRNIFSFYKK